MSDSYQIQNNPNLLNPQNTSNQSVPSHNANITAPFPVKTQQETVYYTCSMLNHHMIRTDGKKLAFVFGILSTNDVYDIQYLDAEIKFGNPYVRKASKEEVDFYQMKIDPRGTMEKQLTPEIESRVRVELEVELRKQLEKKLSVLGTDLTQEQKDIFLKLMDQPVPEEQLNRDAKSIAQTDALQRLRAASQEGVRSGTGTVRVNTAGTTQDVPSLKGIVGTDRLPNQADSSTDK